MRKKTSAPRECTAPNLMDFEWSSMFFFSLSKPSQSMRMVLAIRLFEFRSRKDICSLYANSWTSESWLEQEVSSIWRFWKHCTYLPTVPISSGQSRFGDRNPTSRPTTQKSRFVPICPDQRPKNTILTPAFACSLCSSLGIQGSSVSFGLFSCTRRAVRGRRFSKQKIHMTRALFSCHFPLNARNFVYILGLFFLAVNV